MILRYLRKKPKIVIRGHLSIFLVSFPNFSTSVKLVYKPKLILISTMNIYFFWQFFSYCCPICKLFPPVLFSSLMCHLFLELPRIQWSPVSFTKYGACSLSQHLISYKYIYIWHPDFKLLKSRSSVFYISITPTMSSDSTEL